MQRLWSPSISSVVIPSYKVSCVSEAICVTFPMGSVNPTHARSIDLLMWSALNGSRVPSRFVMVMLIIKRKAKIITATTSVAG